MFRVIVPRIMNPELFRMSKFCDTDMRSPWRMMENMNRNMERLMEDVYNDTWSTNSSFGAAFKKASDTMVTHDPSKFEMKLNVENYQPDDINVTLEGRNLQISAKQEQKEDSHGFISREFTRKILLPESIDVDSLESELTSDGFLVMKAKVKDIEIEGQKPQPIEIKRNEETATE